MTVHRLPVTARPAPRLAQIHIVVHAPAAAPMVDLAEALTDLARKVGGYWEYRGPTGAEPGAFHVDASRIEEVAP